MTKIEFDQSMNMEVVNNQNELEREDLLEAGTTMKILEFVSDPKFIRGVFYTSIPVTISSIMLILAYRRDLLSARSSTSPVFRIPVFLIAIFTLMAPFIIKYGDDTFLNLFSNNIGAGAQPVPAPNPPPVGKPGGLAAPPNDNAARIQPATNKPGGKASNIPAGDAKAGVNK